jgi:hypothetical protein
MRIVVALLVLVATSTARADRIDDLARQLRSDADYKVRLSAALNLGKLGDPRAVPALTDGLADADRSVRAVSAGALGRLIDANVPAADRDRALAGLEATATRDADSMVRGQAQKSLDSLTLRVYVELGPMADTTKRGGGVLAIMRQEIAASLTRRAPTYRTRWPSGRSPSDAELRSHGTTGFFIDASITQLDQTGPHVACAVSMILATYPGKSMFGFLKGNAEIDAGGPQAMSDCVVAVLDDLVGSKIVPTIQARVP